MQRPARAAKVELERSGGRGGVSGEPIQRGAPGGASGRNGGRRSSDTALFNR